ncbi:MAG TPA: GTPase, partial [Firmicutes bacterium]|nr:GTPase [Bacillota bacterium]
VKDLEDTINATDCDVVVIGTPIDLRRLININKPSVRVRYDLQVTSSPGLDELIATRLNQLVL